MDYRPSKPHGQAIARDRHFTLLADNDGVGFVRCDDGVLVVPLDDGGNVLLALERSVAFDREVLVLAGGTVEPGEPLQQTANRELQEELGWHADQLVFLGELHPFKYLTSRQFVFLARELTPSKRPGDEQHPIGTRTVPLASFTSLCTDGALHDAPTIAGIDPAEVRAPAGRSMAAHLRGDASATVRAWELCKTAGTAHVAALIGVHVTDLHAALTHWGLEVPNLHRPAELIHDPAKAREAFALVERVGWVKAAREVGVARRTMRAAFAQWGMGEPVHRGPRAPTRLATDRAAAEEALELAVQVGTSRAAERFGVNPATLYYAWKRWGLERPTDRPEGARRALERKLAAARRADRERHPWRRDRSIWQQRTPDRTADRTGGWTAGHER